MATLALFGLLVVVATATPAPPARATPSPVPHATSVPALAVPRSMYLPDEEDWHALCVANNRSSDTFDRLKCISLAHDPNRYLTLGSELRLKYEHFFNKDWNASNSGYLLERELVNLDLHEDRLRTFVQLEHATATNQHAPIDPTWRDDVATTSAYIEYDLGGNSGADRSPLAVRIGRQLLAYGSQRMIDDRSGLNTEQPFDGVRARIETGAWRTDVFAVRPVNVGGFGFDNLADRTRSLSGVYASRHLGAATIDIYGLVDQRRRQSYYRGIGPEIRDTLGLRYATSSNHIDSDTEIDKQFGTFNGATIASYAIETNVGYSFGTQRNRLRIGAGGGIAPGDRVPKSSRFTLFRAPYPTGLTFGIIEANGNENSVGFAPNLSYTYDSKVTLAFKDYFFYRQSLADGVYSAPGFPLRAPSRSEAAPLGNLGYMSIVDAVDRHTSLYGAYARYLTGPFLRQSPQSPGVPSVSTAYYNLWMVFKF